MSLTIEASTALLARATPLIDLRAPKEFLLGTFPSATNLPLMSDEHRHQVGLRYRQAGQTAAIALGEQLVSGELRAARLQQWREALARQPASVLYCWRGGLRSSFVQHWLAESGVDVPRVAGGYKALRGVALHALLQVQTHPRPVFVLGGATGSGKTVLLRTFSVTVDLEALAQHRGSAFGGGTSAQPSQASFENALACALLQQWQTSGNAIFFEDEARMIGRCALPEPLYVRLKSSALVVVEVPRAERALHIQREYVDAPLAALTKGGNATPHRALATTLAESLLRIRRRLGGLQHEHIAGELAAAFAHHERTGDTTCHVQWISALLEHYYDPMYAYQLEKQRDRIALRGDSLAVRDFLRAQLQGAPTP